MASKEWLRFRFGDKTDLTDYQIAMHEGGFVQVRDSTIISWVDEADTFLPCVDTMGCSVIPTALPDGYITKLGPANRRVCWCHGTGPMEEF